MSRERRIEFPNAFYHVMARGDRRENIIRDETDAEIFEATLAEVVEKSGWQVYGWVLMSNHYHLVIRTPEPNLVRGMSWFQSTYTKRFNARHKVWGHVFSGRYKSIPVEDGSYLRALVQYVHLNPVRAGLIKQGEPLTSYPWSSLVDYGRSVRRRRNWVRVVEGLGLLGLGDTASGRRRYQQRLADSFTWKKAGKAGWEHDEEQTLNSTLRRGWYYGSEAFRNKLLEKLGRFKESAASRSGKGESSQQVRDHSQAEAKRMIGEFEKQLGLSKKDWSTMAKGDVRKGVLAGWIREKTLVETGWLAQELAMGAPGTVSRSIRVGREHLKKSRRFRKTMESVKMSICSAWSDPGLMDTQKGTIMVPEGEVQ